MSKMKRFMTVTRFYPFFVDENNKLCVLKDKNDATKEFKTRKGVENFCRKYGTIHVERKDIFYR